MAKIHDLEIDDYLATCMQVEPLALQEEFVRWAGDYAYWNQRFADASRLAASCKMELDKIGASLSREHWARAEAAIAEAAAAPLDPGKKAVKAPKMPTIGEIEGRVLLEKVYQTAKMASTDAEIDAERLNGVLQALRGKKDMLIQLGYHQRAEMTGDPVLRDYLREQSRS